MKKFLLTLGILLAACLAANAQNKIYCELVEYEIPFSRKVNVQLDFGQESKFFADTRLVDKKGEVITFNSMVDAINYMSTLGWEFVQAYVVSTFSGGNGSSISNTNRRRWILCKTVDEDYDETLQTANQVQK